MLCVKTLNKLMVSCVFYQLDIDLSIIRDYVSKSMNSETGSLFCDIHISINEVIEI